MGWQVALFERLRVVRGRFCFLGKTAPIAGGGPYSGSVSMTALAVSTTTTSSVQSMQSEFQALMPGFERHFNYTFRELKGDRKEEAIAEAMAAAWNGFCHAKAAGKEPSEFPAAIAGFAARRVRCRRPAFGEWSSKDAMSLSAQQRRGFKVVSYDQITTADIKHPLRREKSSHWWMDALVDSRRTSVPRQVVFHIDFANWLKTLSNRHRAVLREFAKEATTTEVARKFGVSMARVSQYRRELEASWNEFNAGIPPSSRHRLPRNGRGRHRHVPPANRQPCLRVIVDC